MPVHKGRLKFHRVLLFALGLTTLIVLVPPITPGNAIPANPRDGGVFTAHINVPLGKIQEGQYCRAYAQVYNGTPPYEYEWSGTYFGLNPVG